MLNMRAKNFHTFTFTGRNDISNSVDSAIEEFTKEHPNAFIVDLKLEANKWGFIGMIIYELRD